MANFRKATRCYYDASERPAVINLDDVSYVVQDTPTNAGNPRVKVYFAGESANFLGTVEDFIQKPQVWTRD